MNPNRTKEQTEQDERDAWNLRQQGYTQTEIAEKLGVDQSTVSRALSRMNKKLHAEFVKQAEEMKAEQTVQLDYIQRQAMDGFERSKRDAKTKRTVTKSVGVGGKGGDDDEPDEVPGMYLRRRSGADEDDEDEFEEVSEEERARLIASGAATDADFLTVVERKTTDEAKGQAGDARFLSAAIEALRSKRAIWGIEAPKKAEISGPQGGPIQVSGPAKAKAEAELTEWRKQMATEVSSFSSAPPTPPTSATPTES